MRGWLLAGRLLIVARCGELGLDLERAWEALVADRAAAARVLAEVKRWNARRRSTVFASSATIVTGNLRTGAFAAVADNVREAVFAALAPGTDVYWLVSDAPRFVAEDVTKALTRWGPTVARAFVEFGDLALYEHIETNCSVSRDVEAAFDLRACLPARSQFFSMARAWTLIVDEERRRGSPYAWILRVRPDMVHKKPLPPLREWQRAPPAAYLDGWRWFRNCSSASRCTCFCAGDRYGVVARSLAPIVFGVAADLLRDHGCSPTRRCPRQFLENDQVACYAGTQHLFPECILGAALLEAGLDPDRDIRKLHSGDLLSCGPDTPGPHAGRLRSPDTEPCAAAYWRHESHRQELGASIADKPIPPVKPHALPFWHHHHHAGAGPQWLTA